jgi:adenylate cyclase
VKADINEWIVHAALAGTSEVDIVAGVCERLGQSGVPVMRIAVAMNLLDPTLDARIVRWVRNEGAFEEAVTLSPDSEATANFLRSPFYALIESGKRSLRRHLDASYRRGEFPQLDLFQDQGATDFIAFAESVADHMALGEGKGVASFWVSDAEGGFSGAQVDVLDRVMPTLTLAFMLRTTGRAARMLLTTYLGRDAAMRVLAGNITRGRAEPIRAVVWYSDLVGFTRISDTVASEIVLAMLNDYAEAQVEEIEAHGGHVLKFIGDGILAIFPDDDRMRACGRALEAAAKLRGRIALVNARRESARLPVTDTHLALHVGELLYGNLGSPRRLDFTVLGAAINMAARMEALCGSLDQKVIVSSAFAEAAGDARKCLVSLGRYAMKGIARPQELFTLDVG